MRTATLNPDARVPTVLLQFPKNDTQRGRPLRDWLKKQLSGALWWNGSAWETNGIGADPVALLQLWGFQVGDGIAEAASPVTKLARNRRHVLVRPRLTGRTACQQLLGLSAVWDAKRSLFRLPIADVCPGGGQPRPGLLFSDEAIACSRARYKTAVPVDADLQQTLTRAAHVTRPRELSRLDRDLMVKHVGRLPDWFGIDLYPYQKVGAMAVACGRRMLADEPGVGKCVSPATFIEVNDDLVRIGDLWERYNSEAYPDPDAPHVGELIPVSHHHLRVPSLTTPSGTRRNASVSHLYRQRYSGRLITITTRSGKRISCTPRHSFWTSQGWLRAEAITPGSFLSSAAPTDGVGAHRKRCEEPMSSELALARVMAWVTAEGFDLPNGHQITNTDLAALQNLEKDYRLVLSEHGITPTERTTIIRQVSKGIANRRPIWDLVVRCTEWVHILQSQYDVPNGLKSRDRFIPSFIMQGSLELQREFLRHYFAGEAWVARNVIEVSSASERLMKQVQIALLRFGVTMNCTSRMNCATNGAGIKRRYWIGTISGPDWDAFTEKVGISNGDKAKTLARLATRPHEKSALNHRIPCMDVLRQVSALGIPSRRLGPGLRSRPRATSGAPAAKESMAALRGIASGELLHTVESEPPGRWRDSTIAALRSADMSVVERAIQCMSALLADGVGWDEVVSVESCEYSGYVYDLVVPETHCYVAEGLFTHNTYTSIAAATLMGSRRLLVVAPPLVITNWCRELAHCGVTAVDATAGVFMAGEPTEPVRKLTAPPVDAADRPVAVVVSDSLLAARESLASELSAWGPDVIIWDEAHRGKTYGSKRSEAVLQLAADTHAAGIAVTGTPMLKTPAELAPLMEFIGVDVTVFNGLGQLLDETCTIDHHGRLRPRKSGESWLAERLRTGVMIRRRKTDVLPQLPDKRRSAVYVDAPMTEFTKAHREVNRKIDAWVKAWKRDTGSLPSDEDILEYATGNLAYISQLRRAAGLCKIDAAEQMIAEHIDATRNPDGTFDDPLIVWTHHREVTEALAARVPGIDGAAMIVGGMNRDRRDELIDAFQAGKVGALVCSIHAAGVGITLTRSHTMIFVETDWTPGIMVQAEDRVHRAGQTADHISITTLVCEGTLDPIVQAALARKARFLNATIGGDNDVYVDEDADATATEVLVDLINTRVRSRRN